MPALPPPPARTRPLRVVAQDPSVRDAQGRILTAVVQVPAEELAPGPRGYRVHVIDYDATTRTLLPPLPSPESGALAWNADPSSRVSDSVILEDPRFHARNAYALVMRMLARFEYALGRRVSWGFDNPGHQIKVAPHAFADANAFYSRRDEALLFGYFPAREGNRHVFTCLSHDVVAHETAHALLDGLRNRYVEPSSMDQAAFHEGFADVVALLSVLAQRELVAALMDRPLDEAAGRPPRPPTDDRLSREAASLESLRTSLLAGMAKELGRETGPIGRSALRHSALLEPTAEVLANFTEAHARGELLVAAVLNAFLELWASRLATLFRDRRTRFVDRDRAAEEGARAADYLLTLAIRALDYAPPVHLDFPAYLSAILTADLEVRPVDDLQLRDHLRRSFARFGILPASAGGAWTAPRSRFSFDRARFEPMQRDADEVFRFVWENRRKLGLYEGAYTRVISVRPCVRSAPEDGFALRETVAEVLQQVTLPASELAAHGLRRPAGMPAGTPVMLFGGVTLIFDEYGRVKYAVGDAVLDPRRREVQERQSARLQALWERGIYSRAATEKRRFSALHRRRAIGAPALAQEEW